MQLFLLSVVVGQTSVADSLFNKANEIIIAEDYTQSTKLYEQIIVLGNDHQDLYYNLGNAYYRLGRYGHAIWAFEKGLQLSPRDIDIKYNLELVQTRVRDRIEIPPTIFLLKWYRFVKGNFTVSELLLISVILLTITVLLYNVKRRFELSSPITTRIMIGFLILALFGHGVTLDKYWEFRDMNLGIVVEKEVNVYSSPYGRADAIIFEIHEGLKLEITQIQDDWFEIILLDGKKGWIRKTSILKI
jgi:tetratricopeptide (TPR) repeat protein